MDAETYLKERVEDQIAWYDRKAAFNKRWFISLRAAESPLRPRSRSSLGSPPIHRSVRLWELSG